MSMLTMKTIMQTFSEMIEEMPFDKITVLALVKRCEINHNTFYYHFQDLYELLDKWIQYEIDKLVKTLEDPTDLKAEMKAIFQACKESTSSVVFSFMYASTTPNGLSSFAFASRPKMLRRILSAVD